MNHSIYLKIFLIGILLFKSAAAQDYAAYIYFQGTQGEPKGSVAAAFESVKTSHPPRQPTASCTPESIYYPSHTSAECGFRYIGAPTLHSQVTVNGELADYFYTVEEYANDGTVYAHFVGGYINTGATCPAGYEVKYAGTSSDPNGVPNAIYNCIEVAPESKPEPDCDCKNADKAPKAGNPIFPATGLKMQEEIDYQGSGSNALQFKRSYRSDKNGWKNNYDAFGMDYVDMQRRYLLGQASWPKAANFYGPAGVANGSQVPKESYAYRQIGRADATANNFGVQRGNGRVINFGNSTDLNPPADVNDRVTKISNSSGVTTGWQVIDAANDAIERYDLSGRLQTITSRNGQTQTFTYSDSATPTTIAPEPGLLIRVKDQFDHQLNFTYDSQARLVTMTDPNGGLYRYAYDEASAIRVPNQVFSSNLTSVTYPDGRKRSYWYNEQDKTSNTNLPSALTGITDENGARFATWNYDFRGKAMSSEHAGGVEKVTLNYVIPNGQTDVTDASGAVHSYRFQTVLGVSRSTGQTRSVAGQPNVSSTLTYDANGNLASQTDFNGTSTTYTYDLARNLEIQRVEAAGTSNARTVSTQWHTTYRLPLKVAEPNRITTNTYDASGNLLTRSEQPTNDASGALAFGAVASGSARVSRFTYNAFGQVLTATGPRTDVVDRTIYSYDGLGNVAASTNALGRVTTYNSYDASGRLLKMTDPNGIVTNLTYSPRGWLTSSSVSPADNSVTATTRYDYDAAGQLLKITQPDVSFIAYTYDPAQRLTQIADSLGNQIVYTLDTSGNRIGEQVKDPAGNLARQTARTVDGLNRLQQVTGSLR